MFYTVKSDYSDTNFTLAEKQLSIYGPEVFLTPLVIAYLPIVFNRPHAWEKWHKEILTHLNPKGSIWKRKERQNMWNETSMIRPQLKLEIWM